jgi:hypothetical protein
MGLNKTMKTLKHVHASSLIYTRSSLHEASSLTQAVEYFHDYPGNFAAITEKDVFIGLLGRTDLWNHFNDQDARALFSNEHVSFLMTRNPLVVDSDFDLKEIAQLLYSRPPETQNNDIVVLNDEHFEGLIQASTLIESTIPALEEALESNLWRSLHPNTALEQAKQPVKEKALDINVIDGSLTNSSPTQLIQLFGRHQETGCLEIYSPAAPIPQLCRIYFQQGIVVHALAPFRKGIEALKKAKALTKGTFRFIFGEITNRKTIPSYESIQTLLFSTI